MIVTSAAAGGGAGAGVGVEGLVGDEELLPPQDVKDVIETRPTRHKPRTGNENFIGTSAL
jgi:hypothetical protein